MERREQTDLVRRISERDAAHAGAVEATLRRLARAGADRMGVAATSLPEVATFDAFLARRIDHTALKPETTPDHVAKLCLEARQFGFAAACVNPCYVIPAAEWLTGSEVAVCTVVGFPLGANHPEVKAAEAERAADDGATELDMVLNVGMLKAEEFDFVEADIREVVGAVSGRHIPVKVILETDLLTDDEKVVACLLARRAGAHFVKTSTGFSGRGAMVQDVALMRRTVGSEMGVKAAGGIRTASDAEAMLAHGADRIGASASVAIVQQAKAKAEGGGDRE